MPRQARRCALGAESHLHRVGDDVHAAFQAAFQAATACSPNTISLAVWSSSLFFDVAAYEALGQDSDEGTDSGAVEPAIAVAHQHF